MRTRALSQVKRCEALFDKKCPVSSPSLIDTKWIAVVKSRSIIKGKGIVPVHSPAEILSAERAKAKRKASCQERMALSSRLTF